MKDFGLRLEVHFDLKSKKSFFA